MVFTLGKFFSDMANKLGCKPSYLDDTVTVKTVTNNLICLISALTSANELTCNESKVMNTQS